MHAKNVSCRSVPFEMNLVQYETAIFPSRPTMNVAVASSTLCKQWLCAFHNVKIDKVNSRLSSDSDRFMAGIRARNAESLFAGFRLMDTYARRTLTDCIYRFDKPWCGEMSGHLRMEMELQVNRLNLHENIWRVSTVHNAYCTKHILSSKFEPFLC